MNDDKFEKNQESAVDALRAFHEDEEGLEILQVVLIIALAAIIFFVIRGYWNRTKEKSDAGIDKALEGLD